ncbi:DNA repair protein rhp54 [Hordeum vulgare]|nr:DNA repair protein rhp54 [Hordeum vulgare]
MDDDLDLDATAGLASLALSNKGKPRAPGKGAAPKPKKVLTPEQRAKESAKRKDRRHAVDARDESITTAAVEQQVTNTRVAAATREALCMLGLNPSQHCLVNAVVAAAVSTGSSAFPRTMLPDLPDASTCNPVPGFHVYPQASRLSGECSPEVSVVAPSATIDLNATPVAVGSSAGGARKHVRQTAADQLPGARNLFDGMPAAGDGDYMQNMIFEGGAQAARFDPDETESHDGQDQGQRSGSREHDDWGGDHEGGSQHRVSKEEAVVREDAGRHAKVRRGVIYGGDRHLFWMPAGVLA